MTRLLALSCGVIAALPFVGWARREATRHRARTFRVRSRRERRFAWPRAVRSVGRVLGAPRARRVRRRRDAVIARELAVVVDLVGVAVSAGCTPFLAIEHAASYGPEHAGSALRAVSRACALGQSLDDALRDLGNSVEAMRPLAEALRTSARLGSPAAPALARVAGEVRADARRRAEARARTIPVRLCFPLVACVLPAFALLTVAPVVLGGMHT